MIGNSRSHPAENEVRPMHVVMLHYTAPPVIGGVERVLYHHARLLAEAGYQVSVVAGRGERFHRDIQFHSLDVVDSRHPDILALKAELDDGRVPPAFEAMRSRILKHLGPILQPADVLIAHNILGLHKNLALTATLRELCAEPSCPRLIAWHHDLAWRARRYSHEMHNGYPWNLLRQPWPNTLHVAVSEARRHEVAALFQVRPEAIRVIPGGVDIPAFHQIRPATHQLLQKTGLAEAKLLLLLPARITRRKNIELAIQATAILRQDTFPGAALVVTGPPGPHNPDNVNYFSELKALRDRLSANDAVYFLSEKPGDMPSDEVMVDLYHLSDALIYPSHEEGFGLPILEAALARLPIFCSDIPALRELAGDQAHYFSPDAAPSVIADLITQVMSADRAALLRRKALGHYGWRHIVHEYLEPLLLDGGRA
jgi:glycosyltransferase involved in cell wall biosynthesis